MADPDFIHLAVALDGTGWHPAAWRDPQARPEELLTARYWADLVGIAERGLLDLVTIEDGLALQSDHPWRADERRDRVRGRLDAVLIAARIAPTTRRVGLLPSVIATHTEPFHLSKAIATLDYVSSGRAGVRIQVSPSPETARHFGRRAVFESPVASLAPAPDSPVASLAPAPDSPVASLAPAPESPVTDVLIGEAADYIEVMRRLWDSWEDDAEIRDVGTGRFIDRTKLHYIDFEGPHFSVRGPSITPRPPQGQPIVAALGHVDPVYRLIAEGADIGFVTPHSAEETTALVNTIATRRPSGQHAVRVFADLVVFLAGTTVAARARKDRLDEWLGAEYRSDAEVFVGTPAELADLLQQWHAAGAAGFRLRPATLPHDLHQITGELVPELRRRGLFRTDHPGGTLRDLLGLPRPTNRYAGVAR